MLAPEYWVSPRRRVWVLLAIVQRELMKPEYREEPEANKIFEQAKRFLGAPKPILKLVKQQDKPTALGEETRIFRQRTEPARGIIACFPET